MKSSLAEFGCDVRLFAGDREGYCMGGALRGRAISGDRVEPRSSRCLTNILYLNQTKYPNDDNDVEQ